MRANWVGAVVLVMAVATDAAQPNAVPMTHYADAVDGVSLDYPQIWKRVTGAEAFCRAAAFPDGGKPAVQFGVEFTGEGNYYEKTGLGALVFLFGTEKNISEMECSQIAQGIPGLVTGAKPQTAVDSRYDYSRGGACGLDRVMDAQVYTRFAGDRCYVFEEDFDRYGGAPAGMRDLTASEQKSLMTHLDGLMQSVQIQSTMLPKSWAPMSYRNAETGVSFEYPASFRPAKDVSAYFSPALTTLKGITFHAKLAYHPPPIPKVEEATTDVSELAFLFATKPVASRDACYKLIDSLEDENEDSSSAVKHLDINGVAFHVADSSDAGLSHFVHSKLYAAYRGGTCYLFEAAVAGLDGYAGDVTEKQWKEIDAHMGAVASTIRFREPSKL